jgi:hypothetical protein
MTRPLSPSGFSLVELLLAVAITMAITGAVFAVLDPSRGIMQVQPETDDLQQRLRVAVDMVQKDLLMAGAGPYIGRSGGPLHHYVAPIMPYRAGTAGGPPVGGIYRPDAVSMVYVPPAAGQAAVRSVAGAGASLTLQVDPNCGSARDRLCGFPEGTRVLVVDHGGQFEAGTVASVNGLTIELEGADFRGLADPARGARVMAVEWHSYWLDHGPSGGAPRLMHADGGQSSFPAVDHVVGLRFEYAGEPRPPALLPQADLERLEGPWTTYGPRPPAIGVDDPNDAWPPGENCVFSAVGGVHASRLAALPGDALATLDPAILTDGPWCPDAAHPRRFDADLLRIRLVRVGLRVEVASDSLRGPFGPLFARPGASIALRVPDQEIHFDVAPRNMNFAP